MPLYLIEGQKLSNGRGRLQWPDLTTIGMVYRVRETAKGESHETVFFISSLPGRVQRIAKHLRGHRGVERPLSQAGRGRRT